MFESNLSMEQHKHFNQLLNQLVTEPPPPPSPDAPTSKIKYEHLTLVDEFYPTNSRGRQMAGREKVSAPRFVLGEGW
jgi:polynucleotide 5'-triphosphatase